MIRLHIAPAALVFAALIGASTWVVAAPSALAQGAPSSADKETARALMGDGNKAFGDGQFQKALDAFAGAHAIMNLPTTGLGVMRSQEKLGLLVEARDTALAINRIAESPSEPKAEHDARAEAASLADSVAARIPSLRVTVSGVAPNVEIAVSIDGALLAKAVSTVPRKLDPGKHSVTVKAAGYLDGAAEATLAEGANETVDVPMQVDPAADVHREPRVPTPPAAKKPDDVEKKSIHPLVWVGTAFTGAGLVAGITGGVIALGSKCDKDGKKNSCPAAPAWISNIGFGVAGVGAVLGIVGIVITVKEPSVAKSAVWVAPVVGPSFTGLRGSF